MTKTKLRPVLVSTEDKFLVFGWTANHCDDPIIYLKDSRLVVYWSAETKGLWGLAAAGPAEGSRVSAPCDCAIKNHTFVLEVTESAAKAFASVAWS